MKLEIFENYMLRGGLYLVMGLLGVFFSGGSGFQVFVFCMLALDGLLYTAGYWKGEKGVEGVRAAISCGALKCSTSDDCVRRASRANTTRRLTSACDGSNQPRA